VIRSAVHRVVVLWRRADGDHHNRRAAAPDGCGPS
jgi:hypothetical protein